MPNLKDKYKYGDIILFRPSGGFVSWLISKIDGGQYSHGAIFWKYEHGVPLFIESHESKGGVVITKLQEWSNFDVYRPTALQIRPAHEVLEMVGRKYDYSMIWWIFKSKLRRKKLQNNDDAQVICTELVDKCYYYCFGEGYICTPRTMELVVKTKIFDKIV